MNKYFCMNRNKDYQNKVENILASRKQEILDFFEVSDEGQFNFNIYIYDTIEALVKGMKDRGFSDMPDYMCACQKDEDNSLNFFEPKDNPSEEEWSKEEYEKCIFHEEIHGIQSIIYGKQPEWLTEGVAKYLDGTYSKGIKWLLDEYVNKKTIPPMYELENEFGMHEYDSYDYAYLMVSYLIETIGKHDFLVSIKSLEKIKELSNNLVVKAVDYYNRKFKFMDYLNQDIDHPKYLFHGSPKKLDKIIPHQSIDSKNNMNNVANAIFLFPSFLKATPYAFKDTIRENSKDLAWNFRIPNNAHFPLMVMENVNIDENIIGYIYVVSKNDSMIKDNNSYQYKCYEELIPCDVIEVKYSDYKEYYQVENTDIKKNRL